LAVDLVELRVAAEAGKFVRRRRIYAFTRQDGVGAGYADGGDGLLLEASIEEKNFIGRGQYIRISAGGGQEGSRAYGVSFTEPY
ncbi:hypothetical protein AB9F45_37620, partial [Rhizobium leguminosarum]|uniref:hypothetical protein n=1 Tax=Rhizobium leguminosarum TaxID=384 RepID=UPI003F9CFF53